jgi:hypothetical protein
MQYEIVKVLKTDAETEAIVTAGVKAARPTQYIQNVLENEDHWLVRLAEFPFEKKDDEGSDDAPEAPADDAGDKEDDAEEKPEESESDDDGEKKDKKDNKSDGEGDALGKLKSLVGEIQSLFDELTNSTQEVADKADEQAGAVEEIGGLLDKHRGPKDEGLGLGDDLGAELGDVGPVPGGGPVPSVPTGPKPAKGLDKRKPGAPGISTFTHREFEYATHPGVDAEGNKISIIAAAMELANSDELKAFEVEALKADTDGKYVAKLKRK